MMNLFFEIHHDLPREGPGDSQSTAWAFSMLKNLPANPRILDIGCGPGTQTLDLARLTRGRITAIDTHKPFLEKLQQRAAAEGFSDRITALEMSMFDLKFPDGSFDLLWSEGAIYIIGFEQGLRAFRRLLKPGGYLAATEISWLKPNPPTELRTFWEADYPGIKSMQANLEIISAQGYQVVGHFILPIESWWDSYYCPIEERISLLRRKYGRDPEFLRQVAENEREIDLYRRFSDWYGYVFYVMQV